LKAPAVGFLRALDERNTIQTTTTPADFVVGSIVIAALQTTTAQAVVALIVMHAHSQRAPLEGDA